MSEDVKEILTTMQTSVTEAVNGLDDALTRVEDRVGVLEAGAREAAREMRQVEDRTSMLERRMLWVEAKVRELVDRLADLQPEPRAAAIAAPEAEREAEREPEPEREPELDEGVEAFVSVVSGSPAKARKPRAPNGSYKSLPQEIVEAVRVGTLTQPFSRAMAVDVLMRAHADLAAPVVSRALAELVEAGQATMTGSRAQARYQVEL